MWRRNCFLFSILVAISLSAQSQTTKPAQSKGPLLSPDVLAKPVAQWSLESFDSFTRIEVGTTTKPWLTVLGNGLFGGHLILLFGNRDDGREFRVDTSRSEITHTDLHWTGLGAMKLATYGMGYARFSFNGNRVGAVHLTYSLEPNANEVWLLENDKGTTVTLQYGKRTVGFSRSIALEITGDRIKEISMDEAREKQIACQRKWQHYLGSALQQIGAEHVSPPLLLREFLWDIYQVAAMVSVDQYPASNGGQLQLRNANMGGTYTVLGLDVHGRDTLQMIPAISRFDPELGREVLLNSARYTDQTGRVCHRRFLSGQPIDRGHSDESFWFVTALLEYLAITQDLSIVEQRAPYLANELQSEYVLFKDPAWVKQFEAKTIPAARFTDEQTAMLEHVRRAVDHVPLGAHGLPLMEDGDWNDALNGMQRGGESIMNAGLYAYCLRQLEQLWKQLGEARVNAVLGPGSYHRDLQDFSQRYEAMKAAVNRYAWDGQWYVRAFDNQGNPVGSHANKEGKIYLSAQSWLILAEIPDEQRTKTMIRSVNQYLRNDNKLSLLSPVYTKPDENIGNITRLPRGSNENGGQWRQCTLWWIAALRKTGEQADAVLLFDQLLLANADLAKMQTEAYLYNEYLRGPEAVDPGSAGQQAHVQQAALVLGTLAELYPGVKITGTFQRSYDFPEAIEEERLYSFTGTGEKVPWTANRVANPPQYTLTLLH